MRSSSSRSPIGAMAADGRTVDRRPPTATRRWLLIAGAALLLVGVERVINSYLLGHATTGGRARLFLGVVLFLAGGVALGLALVRDRDTGR